MTRLMRGGLLVGGCAMLLLAAGYGFRVPAAIATWPWEDGRLSYIFVASIQAAIAAAMLWIGYSGQFAAITAGSLNLLVMMSGFALLLFPLAMRTGDTRLQVYAIACVGFAAANLALFLWAHRLPIDDHQPTPRAVRVSFALFAIILITVGVALILQTPGVMPWPLRPETSAVIGWIFFGDAFYFLYALARPHWHYAQAQLWSFLAYDLVLIGPLLAHLAAVRPDLRINLVLYIAVLIYSGGLAIYYLGINPATRVQRLPASPSAAAPP